MDKSDLFSAPTDPSTFLPIPHQPPPPTFSHIIFRLHTHFHTQLSHSKAAEIEGLLQRLSDVNDEMASQLGGNGDSRAHLLARHRDILQDYTMVREDAGGEEGFGRRPRGAGERGRRKGGMETGGGTEAGEGDRSAWSPPPCPKSSALPAASDQLVGCGFGPSR